MRGTDATVRAMLRRAARAPMLPGTASSGGVSRNRVEVEALLPHRAPFLFIDRVESVRREPPTIACRHELAHDADVLAGHFPGRPVWPGVLLVEAIGQAGLCLARLLGEGVGAPSGNDFSLTQLLGAEFVHPVVPPGHVDVIASLVPDGLFTIIVGQCLQHDRVCAAAALRGLTQDIP